MRTLAFMAATAVLTVAAALGVATAAPPTPTGTLQLDQSAPAYGDTVTFTTTVDGMVRKQAFLYVTLVCSNDTSFYQASSITEPYEFALTDQAGEGLDWFGGPADCEAWFVYRIDKPRESTIEPLAKVAFTVIG